MEAEYEAGDISMMLGLIFLLRSLLDAYLLIIMLRIVLFWHQPNGQYPLMEIGRRFTEPMVSSLRRLVPAVRRMDTPTLLWWLIVGLIKFAILFRLQLGVVPLNIGLLAVLSVQFLQTLIDLFFYAIVALALLSWIPAMTRVHALWPELQVITGPVVFPLQRWIHPIAGIDFTPAIALILLKLLEIMVIEPLWRQSLGLLVS